MESLENIRAQLTNSRERLLLAIRGVTEQQFKQRPEPETWCIAEVLAHLLYTERTWTARIAAALAADGAIVRPTDQSLHDSTAEAGRRAPVPQLIHGLLATRRELERLVEKMEPPALSRTIEHETRGRLTVAWMLQQYGAAHELEHVGQIEALRAAVGVREPVPGPAGGTP